MRRKLMMVILFLVGAIFGVAGKFAYEYWRDSQYLTKIQELAVQMGYRKDDVQDAKLLLEKDGYTVFWMDIIPISQKGIWVFGPHKSWVKVTTDEHTDPEGLTIEIFHDLKPVLQTGTRDGRRFPSYLAVHPQQNNPENLFWVDNDFDGVYDYTPDLSGKENSQSRPAGNENQRVSETTVDFVDYPFGPQWVLDVAENDRKWATHMIDRAIAAYKGGKRQAEILYLKNLKQALEVVQIKGSADDYREPLFIKTDDNTTLSRRLSESGLDVRPSRHAAWNYKDGFIDGLIAVLENSEP